MFVPTCVVRSRAVHVRVVLFGDAGGAAALVWPTVGRAFAGSPLGIRRGATFKAFIRYISFVISRDSVFGRLMTWPTPPHRTVDPLHLPPTHACSWG